MTKFDGDTKGSALSQLDESLQRLEVDHVDLWQFHENIRLEDPDRFFAEGGAAEAMLEAKQKGKVHYFGFTGHKDPSVHLRMLELAAKHNFNFEAVQMPLNAMNAHFRSFEKQVLPVLVQRGIAVLGIKSMASGHILQSKTVSPTNCLHYALSLPTSVVITGIDSMAILDQAFQAASSLPSVGRDEIASIRWVELTVCLLTSMLRLEIMTWTNPDRGLLYKDENGEFCQVLERPRSGKADKRLKSSPSVGRSTSIFCAEP